MARCGQSLVERLREKTTICFLTKEPKMRTKVAKSSEFDLFVRVEVWRAVKFVKVTIDLYCCSINERATSHGMADSDKRRQMKGDPLVLVRLNEDRS